jgi:uncharacterized paraquat-inducible protein A
MPQYVEVCDTCGVVQDTRNKKCAVCKKPLYGIGRYELVYVD